MLDQNGGHSGGVIQRTSSSVPTWKWRRIRVLVSGVPKVRRPQWMVLCSRPFRFGCRGEIARRIEAFGPDAIHLATEGPLGFTARRYCLRHGLPFTSSYTTRFPEYLTARLPIPLSWGYAVMRRFHAPSHAVMVSTDSMRQELAARRIRNLVAWTRGVDGELFRGLERLHITRGPRIEIPSVCTG